MTSFHERQKSLFNQLKDAEEQYSFSKSNKVSAEQDFGAIDRHTYRKVKHEMKQFRGRESIFKRPEANLRECLRAKSVPDYMKNPKKWVYYSLSDVTPDQMSDSTNTATALALIRKMEEKETTDTNMETNSSQDDFVFKKPTFRVSSAVKRTTKPENVNLTLTKNNKIIMPEYVVGVTKKKEKKNKLPNHKSQANPDEKAKKADLKLDHLFEDGSE
ncbi:unnamed protein product [Chilo suppressalis]|uniref:U5 small nuclear ribonucleoprotein TSSC4 n=1 Tax=Chilo suppressalis TaxID=168631 RepID=A0ABN8ASN4_CHISP|nr:hypothetical protein evm_007508 [Chilo suppressalis]CAH0398821.1 unnamed protein product [Chilo suppressalis]